MCAPSICFLLLPLIAASGHCFPEYEWGYDGNDLEGGINTSSWEQCSIRCDEHIGCSFWTWVEHHSKCYLKGSDSGRRRRAGHVSGAKCTLTRCYPDYGMDYYGFDLDGGAHSSVYSWARCAQLCDQRKDCFYWTWIGWGYTKNRCYLKYSKRGRSWGSVAHVSGKKCTPIGCTCSGQVNRFEEGGTCTYYSDSYQWCYVAPDSGCPGIRGRGTAAYSYDVCANYCHCENGRAVPNDYCTHNGNNECAGCNHGFHMNELTKSCDANECQCDNGTPVPNNDCTAHGGNECARCNTGFHLNALTKSCEAPCVLLENNNDRCPAPGCIQKWKYRGHEQMPCANPDNDPNGLWCPTSLDDGEYVVGSGRYSFCIPCDKIFTTSTNLGDATTIGNCDTINTPKSITAPKCGDASHHKNRYYVSPSSSYTYRSTYRYYFKCPSDDEYDVQFFHCYCYTETLMLRES